MAKKTSPPVSAAAPEEPAASAGGEPLTFEQALAALQDIVAQLERGDLSLERALALHSRGQELAAYCAAQLDQAELRVRSIGGTEG